MGILDAALEDSKLASQGLLRRNAVLVTGPPRVGSTYFAELLGLHPDISSTMYSINLYRYWSKSPVHRRSVDAKGQIEAALVRAGLTSENASGVAHELCETNTFGSLGEVYDAIMRRLYISDGHRVWSEKNQNVWNFLPDFVETVGRGCGILLLRNPLDAVSSYKNFTYHSGNTFLGAAFMSLSAIDQAIATQRHEKIQTLIYDDWVGRPVETLIEFVDKLDVTENLEIFVQRMEQHVTTSSRPVKINALTSEERSFVQTICGEASRSIGMHVGVTESLTDREMQRIIAGNPYLEHLYLEWKATGHGNDRYPSCYLDEIVSDDC